MCESAHGSTVLATLPIGFLCSDTLNTLLGALSDSVDISELVDSPNLWLTARE